MDFDWTCIVLGKTKCCYSLHFKGHTFIRYSDYRLDSHGEGSKADSCKNPCGHSHCREVGIKVYIANGPGTLLQWFIVRSNEELTKSWEMELGLFSHFRWCRSSEVVFSVLKVSQVSPKVHTQPIIAVHTVPCNCRDIGITHKTKMKYPAIAYDAFGC